MNVFFFPQQDKITKNDLPHSLKCKKENINVK